MAKRNRPSRRRRRGLSDCGCGKLSGFGMETPEGHLTVQRAGPGAPLQPANAGSGGTKGLLIKGVVVLAAAGAGWFAYKKFFSTP